MTTHIVNILFLGASKRTTLLEDFISTAKELNIDIKLYSCELSSNFCPISHLSTILEGPEFTDKSFQKWLKNTIQKYNINIVIPNMDSATVALSEFKNNNKDLNCEFVVSDYELCYTMNNKILADNFFKRNNIITFPNTENVYPKILKYKLGFGAHNQYIVEDKSYFDYLKNKLSTTDYIVQDYLKGKETSVDFYITKNGELTGYVLRDRLSVSDGEVMDCITREPNDEEKDLIEKIVNIKGWRGCITLQYINYKNNYYVVEINPRFGGGATCAIACGLNMPKYIIQEYLGINIDKPELKKLKMVRSRRDFYYEY